MQFNSEDIRNIRRILESHKVGDKSGKNIEENQVIHMHRGNCNINSVSIIPTIGYISNKHDNTYHISMDPVNIGNNSYSVVEFRKINNGTWEIINIK